MSDLASSRQLGFIFKADNCIGCHSCEAACSEKNGLPPHLAWRKVGYVEGGEFPDLTRVNLSMACNHCDDPVCLKGCPTGAYVKYQDTGAVVVDSDICFGCRYCTWVCPYEAPAFNPETGSVSKCNMCVDRLEQGLKPACVDACLGYALDFGDVAEYDREHPEAFRHIVGFPDPSMTKPNVRFEQARSLPSTMTRTDVEPIYYQSIAPSNGNGRTTAKRTLSQSLGGTHSTRALEPQTPGNREDRKKEPWSSLHSHETSLVWFTLITQFTVGAFLSLWSLPLLSSDASLENHLLGPTNALLVVITGLLAIGLGVSTAHLGKPWRCYRSLNNLRYSWVSREILAVGGFFGGLALYTGLNMIGFTAALIQWGIGSAVGVIGLIGVFAMSKIYLIPARPFWNHPQTIVAFYASALVLGPLLVAGFLALFTRAPIVLLAPFLIVALIARIIGHVSEAVHLRALRASCGMDQSTGQRPFGPLRRSNEVYAHVRGEAEASLDRLLGRFGRFHGIRTTLSYITMGLSAAIVAIVIVAGLSGGGSVWAFNVVNALIPWMMGILFILALIGELIGRALFYVVVTPTTMPGALFVKNHGFEQLAMDTGLAKDPMVGVFPR